MKPVGLIRRADAERARQQARRKAEGRSNAKANPTFALDLTPKLCECVEKAWNDGDGLCMRCGKTL